MSRTIDLTKALSEEDREYLLARGREQQVFANDAQFSDDPEAIQRALYIPGTAVDKPEGVPETPNEPFDDGAEDAETEDNYETWNHDKLQEEIRRRNSEYAEEFQMAVSGTKKELIARLREDDASDEDDSDESDA